MDYICLTNFLFFPSILGLANASNPHRSDIVSFGDKHQQFKRLERNRGVDSKPFKFPPDHSRHIRWPSERHSTHATDSEPASINPIPSVVVFPRSESVTENVLPTVENVDSLPAVSIVMQLNEINEPILPNLVNISVFVANQTAIENGFEPLVYIDDNGLFQVKYVPKGENVSISNNNNQQQHLNEQSLASINKTEETAIISNDNQQIPQDHRITTEPNKNLTPTIDFVHNVSPINYTETIFQWSPSLTKHTTPEQQKLQQSPSESKIPRLFNGLPIFA